MRESFVKKTHNKTNAQDDRANIAGGGKKRGKRCKSKTEELKSVDDEGNYSHKKVLFKSKS